MSKKSTTPTIIAMRCLDCKSVVSTETQLKWHIGHQVQALVEDRSEDQEEKGETNVA